MDVERGRTVKGWRPRRLGEHFLSRLDPGGPDSLLCPLLLSVFPSSFCLPGCSSHPPFLLQLLLSPSSFLVAVFSFWVTD